MKQALNSGGVAVVVVICMIIVGAYLAVKNNSEGEWIVNAPEGSETKSVARPLPARRSRGTTPSKEVEVSDSRENIFEYPKETATETEKEPAKQVEQSKKQTPVATYTATGFSPAVLHVKVGESAAFVNKSGKVLKLTSNYPDFPNSKDIPEISDGKSFSFIFKQKGYWSIGDTNNASFLGIVSVE